MNGEFKLTQTVKTPPETKNGRIRILKIEFICECGCEITLEHVCSSIDLITCESCNTEWKVGIGKKRGVKS